MKQILAVVIVGTFITLAVAQEIKDDGYDQHSYRPYNYRRPYGGHGGYYGYGYKKCPKLDDPENGNVKISGIYPGSKAIHSCDKGYILTGKKIRVCQKDGTWSDEAPTCEPVDCGDPDAPDPNGSVDVGDTTFMNIATYSCNEGYLLDTKLGGSEVVKCLASGEWSDTAPACKPVDCSHPPQEDVNGEIDFTETTYLNTVTYTCNSGYELATGGETFVITCLASGEWSDGAPQCNPVDCGDVPAADENGAVAVGETTYRSTAIYSCNNGYILDTSNGGSQYIYCQANQEWSGFAPACVRIDCGFLDTPQNGVVDFVPDTQLGSSAEFSCRRGYRLVGTDTRVCQANGDWSEMQPSCEKIECPRLKAPKYGKVIVSGYYVDDYAVYKCAYGYELAGDKRRVCQEDGTWSGSEPTCEAKKRYYDHNDYGYGHHDRYGHNDY